MHRTIFENISDFIEKNTTQSILIVEGARQVGKTYAVNETLDRSKTKAIRINLERDRVLRDKIDQTKEFHDFSLLVQNELSLDLKTKTVFFIDECQESELLGGYVRSMREEWVETKILLTGSSTARLFRNCRNPVGRYIRLRVSPFSFGEFLEFSGKDRLVEHARASIKSQIPESMHIALTDEFGNYLKIGGLPKVIEAATENEDYINVRKDIYLAQRDDFINKTKSFSAELFDSCMQAVANHIGSPSKYSQIKAPYREVRDIMSALKEWFLIREVLRQGVDPNKGNFLPKRYLYDMGILKDVQARPFKSIGIGEVENHQLRTYLGGVFENALLINLEHGDFNKGSISTWKQDSKSNKEVDFILERGDEFIPVECKATMKFNRRNFSNIEHYLKIASQKKGVVISLAPFLEKKSVGKTLVNIPIYASEYI